MIRLSHRLAAMAGALAVASPAWAQDQATLPAPAATPPPLRQLQPSYQEQEREPSVYSGDYLSLGVGAVISPSYTGSDDYVLSPIPIVSGSYGGVQFSPRGAGLSIDFLPDSADGIGVALGVTGRLRSDRAKQIEDDVVESLGELDRAVEIGPMVGVSTNGALNPYDTISAGLALGWDVAGAHEGWVLEPSVTYRTPVSRALLVSLTLSAEYAQAKVIDYYFRVTPAQSVATGGELPAFEPDGAGFNKAGGTLLLAYDLGGNLADGGLGLVGILGYSRVLGDAKRSPLTSVRGSDHQLFAGLGIGYTF